MPPRIFGDDFDNGKKWNNAKVAERVTKIFIRGMRKIGIPVLRMPNNRRCLKLNESSFDARYKLGFTPILDASDGRGTDENVKLDPNLNSEKEGK